MSFHSGNESRGDSKNATLRAALQSLSGLHEYQYHAIDQKKQEIRLVHIQTSGQGAISLKLHHHELATAPPYKALSYTWGNEWPLFVFPLDGGYTLIRRNLHDFLRAYCKSPRDEYFWIDQLCIYQANIPERNHQVQMMAEIYSQAGLVIAWLQPSKPDLQCKAGSIKCVCDAEEQWCEVSKACFTHEYWTRVWIVQELVFARRIEVMHGTHSYTFEEVATRHFAHFRIMAIDQAKTRDRSNDEYRKTYMFLMMAGASDTRDKVFAVQALLPEKNRLKVDYNMSLGEVFVTAAVTMIKGGECLSTQAEIISEFGDNLLGWDHFNSEDNEELEKLLLQNQGKPLSYAVMAWLDCLRQKGRDFFANRTIIEQGVHLPST